MAKDTSFEDKKLGSQKTKVGKGFAKTTVPAIGTESLTMSAKLNKRSYTEDKKIKVKLEPSADLEDIKDVKNTIAVKTRALQV